MANNSDYYTKSFSIHKTKDADLYKFIEEKSKTENIAIYIRSLIKMDMQGLISRTPLDRGLDVNIENIIDRKVEEKIKELLPSLINNTENNINKTNDVQDSLAMTNDEFDNIDKDAIQGIFS